MIYDGILIFMTALYSTIIFISREDIFPPGDVLGYSFQYKAHRQTHTHQRRDPKTSNKGPGPRAWGPLFIGSSNTVNFDLYR